MAGPPTGKGRELALVALAALLCLLPFVGKAVHVDDTLFVLAARQIAAEPLDPYGFDVHWYREYMPMADVTKNPPLQCYWLAAVGVVTGFSVLAMHAAAILPALAAVLGTWVLARRWSSRPAIAALSTLFAPAFLVSSTTLMCDVPMLALWVWALVLWDRGLSGERGSGAASVLGAAALAALCGLTKYFGVALVPLLVVHGLARRKRPGWWLVALLLPVAVFAAYQFATAELYGRGLLLDAADYATERQARAWSAVAGQLLVGTCFAGGCAAPLLFLAPTLGSWWKLAVSAAAVVLVAVLIATRAESAAGLLSAPAPLDGWSAAQLGIWITVGAAILLLALSDLVATRSAEALVLCGWVLGTFVFAALVNWTVNGRSVLPLVPAVGILIARRLDREERAARWLVPGLASAAALGLAVAWADAAWAGSARRAARELVGREEGQAYFQGHWGFQHYAEAEGAKPVEIRSTRMSTGEALLLPGYNSNVWGLQGFAKLEETAEFPAVSWGATMYWERNAGFYASSVGGPLPFVLGPPGYVGPDKYDVWRARATLRF